MLYFVCIFIFGVRLGVGEVEGRGVFCYASLVVLVGLRCGTVRFGTGGESAGVYISPSRLPFVRSSFFLSTPTSQRCVFRLGCVSEKFDRGLPPERRIIIPFGGVMREGRFNRAGGRDGGRKHVGSRWRDIETFKTRVTT